MMWHPHPSIEGRGKVLVVVVMVMVVLHMKHCWWMDAAPGCSGMSQNAMPCQIQNRRMVPNAERGAQWDFPMPKGIALTVPRASHAAGRWVGVYLM
jgi:hypothetical protein